jgi:hypothetical protein
MMTAPALGDGAVLGTSQTTRSRSHDGIHFMHPLGISHP